MTILDKIRDTKSTGVDGIPFILLSTDSMQIIVEQEPDSPLGFISRLKNKKRMIFEADDQETIWLTIDAKSGKLLAFFRYDRNGNSMGLSWISNDYGINSKEYKNINLYGTHIKDLLI